VIPHSKLKILATENNLDNWKVYSKHAPRIPTAKDKQKQKDPYLQSKYMVMLNTREGVLGIQGKQNDYTDCGPMPLASTSREDSVAIVIPKN